MAKPRKTKKKTVARKAATKKRRAKVHRCGEAGGRTHTGRPCGQKVSKKGQRCRAHTNQAETTRQREKTIILKELEKGKHLIEAARVIKRDPATVWKWRSTDPEFDEKVREYCEENEEARVSAVEETLYLRIIQGKATPTEIIFYLTNRQRHRWKNRHSQETLGADGRPVDQIPLNQLQAIAAKIDTLEVNVHGDADAIAVPTEALKTVAEKLDKAETSTTRRKPAK